MKRIAFYQVFLLAVILLVFVSGKICNAIPAFARKYQISCQVCHSPAIPRLKAFGDEFAGNGFRMTKYESPRYFIQTGDEKLSLFRELPLAIRIDGFATYNFDDQGRTDFASPFILKILSGGELSEKLSYYFYFLMNEGGSIVGVEDAFMMYHNLLGSGINLYAGQFQASDPLFKGELRYTLEPYKIYEASPGNSSVSLKYERGIMFDKEFKTGTTIVGEILNGAGIGEAGENFLFDKDKYKNFMLKISQSLGKSLSVGFFGYSGREVLPDRLETFTSEIQMFGPDVVIDLGEKLIINAQYVRRTDSEVFLDYTNLTMKDVMTQGGFAEVIYSPRGDMSKWYLTGLLNWVESDLYNLDYRAATLHAGYMLRRNVRLVSEFTYKFSGNSYGKLNVGFVSAF
jgi:hypothetical protein